MLVDTPKCGRLWVDVLEPPDGEERSAIVLWHSVLCTGEMWATIPDALARTHRVINVDAPGHGRSSPTRARYTLDDCVDAALAVLDACGVERAIWCGLSWGGMVGMRLAIRAPERVRALVLIDTNADREVPQKLPKYRAMALFARAFGPTPLLGALDRIYFSPHTRRTKPDVVEAFHRTIQGLDRESVQRVVDAVIVNRSDVRPQLARIQAPTLVIVGEDDTATPRQRSEDIASRIPGARLVEIHHAGHLSAWEQPEAVLEAIEGFLATLDRR